MSTVTLELSEIQLQALKRLAVQRGTSIHTVMLTLIDELTKQPEPPETYDITEDPLYNIVAHETEAPADLSQHADHYLYGALKA
jgi:hypothetical protein